MSSKADNVPSPAVPLTRWLCQQASAKRVLSGVAFCFDNGDVTGRGCIGASWGEGDTAGGTTTPADVALGSFPDFLASAGRGGATLWLRGEEARRVGLDLGLSHRDPPRLLSCCVAGHAEGGIAFVALVDPNARFRLEESGASLVVESLWAQARLEVRGFVSTAEVGKDSSGTFRREVLNVYRQAIRAEHGVAYETRFAGGTRAALMHFIDDSIEELAGIPASAYTQRSFVELVEEVKILDGEFTGNFEQYAKEFVEGHRDRFRTRLRIRRPDGEVRFLTDNSVPVRNRHGKVIGSVGILRDVTEGERAILEKDRMRRQMETLTRFESLAVFSGGIAHDFNNLLVGILGSAEIALMDIEEDSPAREALLTIQETAEKAAGLTHQLLSLAGKRQGDAALVDISRVLKDSERHLRALVEKQAPFVFRGWPEPLRIEGDPSQIYQVVVNLLMNAAEAMKGREGTVELEVRPESFNEEGLGVLTLASGCEPGGYAVLRVRDNGIGMLPDVLERMFDPFFTTKESGHGLGMSAVLNIIRRHNGWIDVKTAEGEGTEVRVGFPCFDERPNTSDSGVELPERKGQRQVVLVVDDEPLVRRVVGETLERTGFDVYTATDGAEGEDVFSKVEKDLTLAVLDLKMPNGGGHRVFRAIRRQRDDLPIIIMSGFHEEFDAGTFSGDRLCSFLGKPFPLKDLTDLVRDLEKKRARFLEKKKGT